MGDLLQQIADLIEKTGGLISAVGGLVGLALAFTRGSSRERRAAARYAIKKVLGREDDEDDDSTDAAQWAAIEELRAEMRDRDEDKGSDEDGGDQS